MGQNEDELLLNEGAIERDPLRVNQVKHPVVIAVQLLLDRLRDIEDCGGTYPQLARERGVNELRSLVEDLENLLEHKPDVEGPEHSLVVKELLVHIRKLTRIANSDPAATMLKSLFLGVFSLYDGFTGNLLEALFERKPELFFKLGRTVPVVDVLRASSIESFKRSVLEEYVESFRRQSYVEQFDSLEKLFDISLKKFNNWPKFVEVSQRRNLVAHCDAVVSEQYVTICNREGVDVGQAAKVGTRLLVDSSYLLHACQIVKEVALKLAQTLWRKALPSEIVEADQHLVSVSYEALQMESWEWAQVIGEFAMDQKRMATERSRLIVLVNLLISLKFGGKAAEMQRLLSARDWSATSGEFRLAVAVLGGDFAEAARIMHLIGGKGEILDKTAYHDWPLFRDFRSSREFLEAYEKIYKHPFIVELERKAKADVSIIEGAQGGGGVAVGELEARELEGAVGSHEKLRVERGESVGADEGAA